MLEKGTSSCDVCGYPGHAGHAPKCPKRTGNAAKPTRRPSNPERRPVVEAVEKKRRVPVRELAAAGMLAALAGTLVDRFSHPDESADVPTTEKRQTMTKQEVKHMQAKMELAGKVIAELAKQAKEAPVESAEGEEPAVDLRTVMPTKEELVSFPDQDPETSPDVINLYGKKTLDMIVASNFTNNPEFQSRFDQAVQNMQLEVDDTGVHAYLPGVEDFDVVITLDHPFEEDPSMVSLDVSTLDADKALWTGSEDEADPNVLKKRMRQQIQGDLLVYLRDTNTEYGVN